MGHGALLLGHQHPDIVAAVSAQAQLGTHYGASHEAEIAWGEMVCKLVPSAERLRFTSSGTEATMMALRLARAFTGREKVLRLCEHFHGWNDSVYGQPRPEETVPSAPGLPRGMLQASIVIPQNDVDALERTLREDGDDDRRHDLRDDGRALGHAIRSISSTCAARASSPRVMACCSSSTR